jgi:hypothetical protein
MNKLEIKSFISAVLTLIALLFVNPLEALGISSITAIAISLILATIMSFVVFIAADISDMYKHIKDLPSVDKMYGKWLVLHQKKGLGTLSEKERLDFESLDEALKAYEKRQYDYICESRERGGRK